MNRADAASFLDRLHKRLQDELRKALTEKVEASMRVERLQRDAEAVGVVLDQLYQKEA